jgi:hypothetical protein
MAEKISEELKLIKKKLSGFQNSKIFT